MTTLVSWLTLLRQAASNSRAWSALGVLSASVVMVNLNVLSARFYERWDATDAQNFTLSHSSLEILGSLTKPVNVVVFLARGDRLLVDVRHMLSAYQAETRQLSVTYVDPERDPAEFLALQQKFGIVAGKSEDGKLLTDASVVLTQDDRRWFLTPDDLVGMDGQGNLEPRLEASLTEGIAQVTRGETLEICFSEGHQEASLDDVGPHGLSELRIRLTKSNLRARAVDLGRANPRAELLDGCDVTMVAGPKIAFAEPAALALRQYFDQGGRLLLFLDPFVDESGQLQPSGLEGVTAAAGIRLGEDFVIERDPELRLPNGFGEAFLATPEAHSVTEGLMRGGSKVDFRVLVVGSQSLGTTPDSPAKPLLVSSARAFALRDLSAAQKGDRQLLPLSEDESGPYYLALASKPASPEPDGEPPRDAASRRMVVSGAANLVWSRNWRDPSLIGNRLFVENAVSWLVARPALVSVPKKRAMPAGLSLTEESLTDVLAYVMLYMPLTAALMGGFVLYRRRRQEARARDSARESERST